MSYGQVYGYTAQKVRRFAAEPVVAPQIEVDYVAFPYEISPFNLVEGNPPWSFSVIEDKAKRWGNNWGYFDHATISVTRVYDGVSLPVGNIYPTNEGLGVPKVLSWQVRDWDYDTLYEVEISNVAMQSGETRRFSYQVFIERDERRSRRGPQGSGTGPVGAGGGRGVAGRAAALGGGCPAWRPQRGAR